MTEHVNEEIVSGPNFTKDEIKIYETVLSLSADEAFDWLLNQFNEYMHGKIIWLEVRNIFATAKKWQENRLQDIEPEVVEIEEVIEIEIENI